MGVDRLTRGVPAGEGDLTYAEVGHVDTVGHRGASQKLVMLHAVEESGLAAGPVAHHDQVGSIRDDLTRCFQLRNNIM